jgi:hypothetical protein
MPQFKLEPKFKKHWLEALESGKYKQGRRSLRGNAYGEWCCLGVACDVIIQNNMLPGAKWVRLTGDGGRCFAHDGVTQSEALPPDRFIAVMFGKPLDSLQFVTKVHIFKIEGGAPDQDTLYHANDAGMGFDQIAQIIREQF